MPQYPESGKAVLDEPGGLEKSFLGSECKFSQCVHEISTVAEDFSSTETASTEMD